MTARKGHATAEERLAWLFYRNGYVRWQNQERRVADGPRYRKGDEVRLVVRSRSELATVRRLLRKAEFKPGNPFPKGNQYAVPLYGRAVVERFLEMVDAQPFDQDEVRERENEREGKPKA